MNDLFNQWGNFLFHTRNVLFPVFILVLLFIWSPVALTNAASCFVMTAGLLMVALGQLFRITTIGLDYIVRGGRNRRIYAEDLVTGGLFSHCRNPLYVGNILIAIGYLFVGGNWGSIIVGSLAFLAIYRLIVHSEETFLSAKFGQAYADFCADVPRWMPKFEGFSDTVKGYQFDWPAVAVKDGGTIFMSVMVPVALIAWKLQLANQLGNYQTTLIIITVIMTSAFLTMRFLKKSGRLKSMR
ncbi:MAG: isoprenylcysteine carboxylmethyltransferase family protein [Methylococcales bacterium]|nr:isoprenylcysteine carboxylmethyltransferase family protein [Methylococcales bacterium]